MSKSEMRFLRREIISEALKAEVVRCSLSLIKYYVRMKESKWFKRELRAYV